MRLAPLLALLLVGCTAPGGTASGGVRTGGIVSTNPCADAMLVELAPERLTAISQYSHDPAATSLPLAVARRFPATAGTAEEVIALHPVLIVTSSFTPLATRDAYARVGLKVLLLDSPTSVAASEAQIRLVAAAVGEPGRGEALVARIERALAAAAAPPSPLPRRRPGPSCATIRCERLRSVSSTIATGPRPAPGKQERKGTLLFISSTLANGPGNLLDELMTRAGLPNAASRYGLTYTGRIALEKIAAAPPALILTPGPSRADMLRNKVLARMRATTRQATFPRTLINCGGPTIVPAITRLAAIRRELS